MNPRRVVAAGALALAGGLVAAPAAVFGVSCSGCGGSVKPAQSAYPIGSDPAVAMDCASFAARNHADAAACGGEAPAQGDAGAHGR